ncbi:MAG TPA: hypothetical protein VM029_16145, partial [Opitutaceae bacterium]|nr:hypothetical protein [Opitutaceae bacterium]
MSLCRAFSFFAFSLAASAVAAAATIEGRVTLPKTRTAPLVNQRYQIVAKGGVVSTNPPLAVIYVEGNF